VQAVSPVLAAAPAPTSTKPASTFTLAGGCQQYLPLVEQYDWDVKTAMAIMSAESTTPGIPCNSGAIGTASYDGVKDYGLFQLHGIDILDPAQNVAFAYYHKYLTQGWHAWSSYNNGSYLAKE
jgi:hypothetical protein